VPSLEAWEKVLVNGEAYLRTVHGQIPCMDCHNGEQSSDKTNAHNGLIANSSSDPKDTCGECHPDVVAMNQYSLHTNLAGYWKVLDPRRDLADSASHAAITEMFDNHCDSCHATCGDCHVSQPALVGGGFIDGHLFNRTPLMTRNCTACHGSRIGNEYLGKHEGLLGDVHLRVGRMNCVDCHSGHEMHGQPAECQTCHIGSETVSVAPADHRYAGVQQPRCETCHTPAAIGQDGLPMHEVYGSDLSCQVCHSIAYTSCDNCHVALSDTTGSPFFKTEASYLGFYIGLNDLRSYDRPYKFVPVRHVPISTESFSFYGENLLPSFDALPTWKYTTPHNIQRITPQVESCNSCHGNPDLFLTIDKVKPEEVEANLPVIVGVVPPIIITNTITTTNTLEEAP
jgi:hypothetical protein